MTMPGGAERGIVILDIDEKSLGEIGRWPWSRRLMAETVTKLFERHGIALLGFDVVFAERDPSSGIETLDSLSGLEESPDRRARFHYTAAVIARDELHDHELTVDKFNAALDLPAQGFCRRGP